jgi:3-dehydroquinate dehydratase
LPMCVGSVTGFGPFSYSLALAAAKEIVSARRNNA